MLITRAITLALTPSPPASFRVLRYRGEDQAVSLDAFSIEDQRSFFALYDVLQELQRAVTEDESRGIEIFLRKHDLDGLAALVTSIGARGSYQGHVATAAHDVRGGALSALFVELDSPAAMRVSPGAITALTRDSLKLMRNLLVDIDPVGRARDLERRVHSLDDLVASLRNYQGTVPRGRVHLDLHADANVVIAASCTELGTIERVAFNILGNAARHSQSSAIEAWLVVVGEHLRVAIVNDVETDHRERVRQLLGADPGVLYSAFSTTSSGYGLQIAAELVSRAYGVDDVKELVAGGYVGTAVLNDSFVSWFHWPLGRVEEE